MSWGVLFDDFIFDNRDIAWWTEKMFTKNHMPHSLRCAPLQKPFMVPAWPRQELTWRSVSLEHRRHSSWQLLPHGPKYLALHHASVHTRITRYTLHHPNRPWGSDGKPDRPARSLTGYVEGRKATRNQLRISGHHSAKEGEHRTQPGTSHPRNPLSHHLVHHAMMTKRTI